jgi:hypothetical protein
MLNEYKDYLEKEAKGVSERIKDLEKELNPQWKWTGWDVDL